MKNSDVKKEEKEQENINNQPTYYIIKDEIFEELKDSIKILLLEKETKEARV